MPPAPRDVVERLYAAPPDGFVAARDAAVAEARATGDVDTARQIAKLRKPTVAAWLVNLLALRRPDLIAQLTDLAGELRAAQRELRGPELRELSTQRRAMVSALVAEIRRLARQVEQAPPAGKLPLAEVETTLNAALADPDVAEQVRSGRLIRAASYAGFGEVPRPRLRLISGGEVEPAPEPAAAERAQPAGQRAARAKRGAAEADRAKAERAARAERGRAERAARAEWANRRRAVQRELTQARTERQRAEAELDRAVAAEREQAETLAELTAQLAELERRRAAAEQEAGRRKLARKGAERALAAARRRAGEVEAALENLDREGAPGAPGGGADSGR